MFKVAQDLHQEPPSITWQAYSRELKKGSHGSNETGEEASYIPIPNFLDLGSVLGIIVTMYQICTKEGKVVQSLAILGRICYILQYIFQKCSIIICIQVKNWFFFSIGLGSYVIKSQGWEVAQAQCANPKTLINT